MNNLSRTLLVFLAVSVSNCFGIFGFGKNNIEKIEERTTAARAQYGQALKAFEATYEFPDYKEEAVKSAVLKSVARDERFPYGKYIDQLQKDLTQLEKDCTFLTKRVSKLYGAKKDNQKQERERVLDVLAYVEFELNRIEDMYVYIKSFHELHQERNLEMKYKKNSSSFVSKVAKGVGTICTVLVGCLAYIVFYSVNNPEHALL